MDPLATYKEKIISLCETHNVDQLFVCGSVLTSHFSEKSDVDFIVSFLPIKYPDYSENYFDLKDALELLLSRKVDLLEEQAIKNPYFKQSVNQTKLLVYGSRDKNLVV